MKLLIVTGIFPPDIGGPATYVPQIAGALNERGHHVVVVTLSDSASTSIQCPFTVVRLRRGLFKPLRILLALVTLLRFGRRADLVFVNGLNFEVAIANLFIRKPLVLKVVGDWAWERATNKGWINQNFEEFQKARHSLKIEVLKALRTFCVRRTDKIIVPSHYLARWVARWKIPEEKIAVIYNAVEGLSPAVSNGRHAGMGLSALIPSQPAPFPFSASVKIVTVGRLVPWKQTAQIIGAVAQCGGTGLVVVGDGPERSRLEKVVQNLDLDSRVFFAGKKSKEETLSLVAGCDLFVLNSTYEGFPHVVLEAMTLGLPVVATAVGGTTELVRDGENGVLVPPAANGELSKALLRLVSSSDERQRLADGAKHTAERFRLSEMVEATEAVLLARVRQVKGSDVPSGPGHETAERESLSPVAVWELLREKVVGQKFVQDVGALTIANVVAAALNFVQGILIARWLGPELYGVTALVMSYPSLLYTVFDARSSEASIKYLSEFHARGDRNSALAMCKLGYVVDIGIASSSFLVVLLTAPWAAEEIARRPEASGLICVYAAAFMPGALVGTSYAVMATFGRFLLVARLEILITLLRVSLVLGFVLMGWQVSGVVWGNAVATITSGLLYGAIGLCLIYRTWGASPLSGRWHVLKGRRREILGFVVYNDLSALVGMIPKQLDVLLLGYFRSPMEVGYYKLAKSLSTAAGYLVGPLQWVTYPELVRLAGLDDKQMLRRKVRRLALKVATPLALAVLGGTLLVPFILPVLVGHAYLPALSAAQLLLIGSAIWLGFFWLRPLYMARDNMLQWLTINTLMAVLSLGVYLFVVPYWGYLGLSSWQMAMQLIGHGIAVSYLLSKGRWQVKI